MERPNAHTDATVQERLSAAPSRAGLRLERRPLAACAPIRDAWSDLATRAVEANPFLDPDYLLPAAQHLVGFRDASALLIWRGQAPGDAAPRLVGFLPYRAERRLIGQADLVTLNEGHLPDATPLLAAGEIGPVVQSVLRARGSWGTPAFSGVTLSRLDLAGALAQGLSAEARAFGYATAVQPAGAPEPLMPGAPDLAALRHGLSCFGELALSDATTRTEIRDMVEILLALDASGERARQGNAILQDTRETSFLRSMTRNLARTRQCRIGLLTLGGEPIAGAILIGKGPRPWLYLATHDERYASFAPEAQLVALMKRRYRLRAVIGGTADGRHRDERSSPGLLRLREAGRPAPRDLATRAAAALRRLRHPRAEAAG